MDSASDLGAVQSWMQAALLRPAAGTADEADQLLVSSGRLPARQGLAVYQRSYILRLISCMGEQFPALRHALGGDLFDDFAAEYLRDKPPESYTLYDLGRRFPAYLDARRPDRDQPLAERETWIDFMVDLARFERMVFVMFDAPGNEGRPFATADTPDSRLRLQPGFALGAYRFPVATYYHQVRENLAAELPPCAACHVALVRRDFLTHTIPLSETHFAFLSAMQAGGDIEAALSITAELPGLSLEAVRDSWNSAGGVRQRWIEAGFFVPPVA